jgi:hypothetical protein
MLSLLILCYILKLNELIVTLMMPNYRLASSNHLDVSTTNYHLLLIADIKHGNT